MIASKLSTSAMNLLQTTYLRVKPLVCAERVWEQLLLPDDRVRLGGDLENAWSEHHSTVGMWQFLRGISVDRAVIELGQKLNLLTPENTEWLLREIGESADNPEQLVDKATESGALVLIEQPREAYWKTEMIEIDWETNPVLWNFLWELARHAKGNRPIDNLTFGDHKKDGYASKLKYRLVNDEVFPDELRQLIKPAGKGSIKLNLARSLIRIFQISPTGSLCEVTA